MYLRPSTSRRLLSLTALFTPVPFVGLTGLAHAANQTYLDTSLLNTWNLTDANWDAGSVWVDHNSAIFGGTGEAVTVTAVAADGITFNSAGYSLTGGTITLGQSATPIVANADVAINSVIAGSGTGFAKSGNGTLTLGATNTFDGLIDVNAGTLKLGAASSTGTGSTSIFVLPGATLDFGGFNAGTRAISIAGTGASGAALYNSSVTAASTLGAAVTLDGDTTLGSALNTSTSGISATINLNGFTLTVNSGRWLTSNLSSGNITVNSGGVVLLGNGSTEAAGTLKINTGGIVDVRDFNNTARTDTLAITLNGGLIGNANALGTGGSGNGGGASGQTLKNAIFVDAAGGTLNGNNTAFGNTSANFGLSFSGALTGSGPLALSGGKGINLKGDTSGYTGTATNSTTLIFNAGASNQTFNGVIAGSSGSINQNGTGVLTLAGANTYSGATNANAGTLRLDYSTSNSRKIGSGVLTLAGGAVELSGGTAFTDSVASTSLTSGTQSSIRRVSGTNVLDLKAITPNTGRVDFSESGIATTTNANNAQGILGTWATVGGTAWAKNDGTGLIVAVTPSGTVSRRSGVAQTIPNNAAADIQIIEGAGTATNIGVAAATTTINSLAQSSVGGNSPAIIDPAGQTLAVNGILVGTGAGSLTIGSGVNNGTLKSAATALTFRDLAGAGITVNSAIADGTGASSLTKFDSGTLVLNGANSYTGGTIVNDGILRVGNAAALPAGQQVTLNNAATLDLNGQSPSISTLAGSATVTDSLLSPGSSTLSLTNATAAVGTRITNGTLRPVALRVTNNNNNFSLNNSGNTFSGGIVLTNSASGTRLTAGTITAGAYGTGPITVGEAPADKAGIYLSSANQTLANPVISNTGLGSDRLGTIRVGAAGLTMSGLLTANQAPFTFGNSTGETGAVTLSGKVTGPNGVTLAVNTNSGASLNVTLTNTGNDYAGDTVVNRDAQTGKSQAVVLGASNVIPNGFGKGNVVLNTNGTGVGRLNMGGFSETINGLSGTGTVDSVNGSSVLTVGDNNATSTFSGSLVNAAGALALSKIGTGTLTLSGNNSYGGATTVNAGTLAITGAPTGVGAFNVNGGTLSLSGSPAGNSAVNVNGGVLSLDYGTSNTSKIHNSAVLTLNGGTVTLAGETGDHVEAVASTTLGGGVTLNRSGANTAKLALGAITRGAGGALEVASAGLATTTTANNAGGTLSGVTLAGGLAMNDGSGNIVAYSGAFADVTRLGGVISNGAASQVRIIGGGTTGNIALDGSGTNTIATLTNASTDGLATVDIASGRVLRLGVEGSIISPSTSTGLTISGPGTLTAGGTDNTAGDLLVLNQSATATNIGAVIANNGTGAVSLTKFGSGALNLTGVNTFTGGVRVNEGTVTSLVTTTQNSLGTGAVAVSGGSTLSLNNTNTSGTAVSVPNIFSGGGIVQLVFANGTTARNTSLSGTNALDNFTGTVRLSLAAGATSTGDKFSGFNDTTPAALVIEPGTQLNVAGSTSAIFTGGITVSGTGNSEGRGAMRLIGTVGGTMNLAGDTSIGTEGGTISGPVTSGAAGTQTLTFGTANSTGALTVSGSIGGGLGTINLVKTRTGTLTLSGSNTYTGTVVVNDGALLANGAGALGAATQLTVENADTSGNNTNSIQLAGGTTHGTGTTLTLHNAGTTGTIGNARPALANQAGNNTWAGNIIVRGGVNQTLINDVASTTLTVNGSISQHGTEPTTGVFIRGTNSGVMNGTMSLGTATVTKTDAGTWTIASTGNTWGNTGVAVGTLRMGAVNALPATTLVTVGQNDTANVTLDLNGFSQTVGGIAVSTTGGTKQITSTTAATLTVNNAAASNFGGVLAGAGLSLAKSGAGTLTLSGVNTYTGNTTVNAGTLELADNARLRFVIGAASGVTNSISGAGTATLAGDFAIDTTAAAALTSGSWLIENVASLTGPYGATFQVVNTDGTPWTDAGGEKWTKTEGANTWTFNEATGMLTLGEVGYDSWASVIPNANDRDRGDDPDGDGFTNLQEYLFGTSPVSGGGSLLGMTRSGSNVTLRWLQLEDGGSYVLKHSAALSGWTAVPSPLPALDANQTGAPADYDYYTVTLPLGAGKEFFRIEGTEN